MGAELGSFKFGNATFPLTASTAKSLLEDADPALHAALQFLPATFELYFSARLKAQAQIEGWNLPSAVVSTHHLEPKPHLLAHQFKLPLFALWRIRDVWDEHTIAYDKSSATWGFTYLLPPLQPRQADSLAPILRAASIVLRRAIHMGQDPNYLANTPIWGPAGIMRARLLQVEYGEWNAVDNLNDFYRAITGTISVLEREMPNLGEYDSFQGASVQIDHRAPDDTVDTWPADVETNVPPTIASVSPTSGTTAGNTLLVITGTGFRVGSRPIVYCGAAQADAVTVVSATRIECRTPPHAAYPSELVDVTVLAVDGQSATLEDAFTFNQP